MSEGTARPNVLFIICDQLRADFVGFGGHPVIRTPNIDRIADRAVVFDKAYVSNPVCMPNRSTIMTGRMPSAHGVIFNDRSLSPIATTFVGRFRDAGYATGLIGKSHLQHGSSREAVADFGMAAGAASPFAEGWDTVEHQERYWNGEVIAPDDFYGFGHIQLSIGHGAWTGGHHYQWARERGATHEQLMAGFDPHADIPGRSPNWWQVHPAPFDDDVYSTTFVTEKTIAFIEEQHAAGTPWLSWTSFPDPHHPMSPPEPWFSRYSPDDIELPSTFDDPGDGWPIHLRVIKSLEPDQDEPLNFVRPFGPTERQAREAIAATYGMIEAIDHGVGRILDRLDDLGAADDTVIVFTSDHGDMMGDHGLLMKGAMHFQGCLRVPLAISAPGSAAGRTSSLAASIDLPHTLLDLCGVDGYQGMQGHSLVPLLDDQGASVRRSVLVEDDFPPSAVGPGLPEKTRTIVTDDFRYSRDVMGQEQLYRFAEDPDELTNLAIDERDPALRYAALDALTDAMLRADDLTRMEPVAS
ncbi:MAG: sulfatase-like hydrolase/transferase [Actinomycetota bacterium]